MPRMTLLELTQDIISDMSGDYISSISDTDESEQVAQIVKNTYWELIESKHTRWEHLRDTLTLSPSGDTTKPAVMLLNSNVYKIQELWYNKRTSTDTKDKFQKVHYLIPEDFLEKVNGRDSTESNYESMATNGITVVIRNDQAPMYYTSFDDETFVFDAYDSAVETTLQSSKTQVIVHKIPTWTHTDSAIPDLPPQAFSLLLAEAKSVCWNALKQLPNAKEEQRAARLRSNINNHSEQINNRERPTVYGRRRRK